MLNYTEFESLLSPNRINRYLIACNNNEQKALELYRLNIQLSTSMFGIIALFEIVLRNKIDAHYKKENENWLINGFLHNSDSKECQISVIDIDKVKKELKIVSNDNILANISFGFWQYLFAPEQDNAGGASLLSIFSKKPKSITRKDVQNILREINLLRNKIAHHEPICFQRQLISNRNTRIVYYNMIQLIHWLDINPHELFDGINNVPLYLEKTHSIKKLYQNSNEILNVNES